MPIEGVSPEAFTTAYWWGSRLRQRRQTRDPFPEAVEQALDAGDLRVALVAMQGISMFAMVEVIDRHQLDKLTETQIRTFESALARLIDTSLAEPCPSSRRPAAFIQNGYEPDPLIQRAARQSGWDAGLTIFENGSGSATFHGLVIAGAPSEQGKRDRSEGLPIIDDYPSPEAGGPPLPAEEERR